MYELVVISGKGGTGKTSVVASFAALAKEAVIADCDVDAANLHLALDPEHSRREPFYAGHRATIDRARCTGCGRCEHSCRFGAIVQVQHGRAGESSAGNGRLEIDPYACEGCGVCVRTCPEGAIRFDPCLCGAWMTSDTRFGPMVHARLEPAGENSGKLVTQVRNTARSIARDEGRDLILVDGPPGIGCPVIASIGGADRVLIVTEPTKAAEHDLQRAVELCTHFGVPASVCVNRADINHTITERILRMAQRNDVLPVGAIPYDQRVTEAQRHHTTVVEYGGAAADAIASIWQTMNKERRATMRIAIPVENGVLSAHFGHCRTFLLVDVDPDSSTILGSEELPAPDHEPGLLPRWLADQGTSIVIAGGMGGRAQQLFEERDIQVVVGAPEDDPNSVVTGYLAGTLGTGTNRCDH